jgi:hypothetical protein
MAWLVARAHTPIAKTGAAVERRVPNHRRVRRITFSRLMRVRFFWLNLTGALSICPGAVSAYLLEVIDKAGCNADATRCARSLEILIRRQRLLHERAYKESSLFTVHLTSPCARALRSSARARERRDMTVPMAVPVICAISAYDRPSISRSTRMSR